MVAAAAVVLTVSGGVEFAVHGCATDGVSASITTGTKGSFSTSFVFSIREAEANAHDVHILGSRYGIRTEHAGPRGAIGHVFGARIDHDVLDFAVDLVVCNATTEGCSGSAAGGDREVHREGNEEERDASHGDLGITVGFQVVHRVHGAPPCLMHLWSASLTFRFGGARRSAAYSEASSSGLSPSSSNSTYPVRLR